MIRIFLFVVILMGLTPIKGQVTGQCGISVVVKSDTLPGIPGDTIVDHIDVTQVIPGGPADRAGMRNGDEIIQIDEIKVAGLKFIDVVTTMLRGQEGTMVRIVVKRAGEKDPITLTAIRGQVVLPHP